MMKIDEDTRSSNEESKRGFSLEVEVNELEENLAIITGQTSESRGSRLLWARVLGGDGLEEQDMYSLALFVQYEPDVDLGG
jgi:hypothetical protein